MHARAGARGAGNRYAFGFSARRVHVPDSTRAPNAAQANFVSKYLVDLPGTPRVLTLTYGSVPILLDLQRPIVVRAEISFEPPSEDLLTWDGEVLTWDGSTLTWG